MNNVYVTRSAMFVVLAVRRWLKTNPRHNDGDAIYVAARLDRFGMMPVAQPWPIFYHADDDFRAYLYAQDNYPMTTHLLKVDLSKGHPNSCVEEI